ncbi:MAG: tRNA (adenosine(37)-N6)-dimethylallyltransferase MiaA [Desulfobacterales bacterium]
MDKAISPVGITSGRGGTSVTGQGETHSIDRPRIIVICGPTGLGKTAVAVTLAEAFHAEIISADSMQIYRHMTIGTAKPTPLEQAGAPHHMIDIVDPDQSFDAAQYARMARAIVVDLHGKGRSVLVVGGTGLYIKALVHGLFQAEPPDPHIRQRLKEEVETIGMDVLYRRLVADDPAAAGKIHANDQFRIIRALEVREATGQPISDLHQAHGFVDEPFAVLKIGLHMERDALYDRINRRVDAMIDKGLLAEVQGLLTMGYSADLKSMQSIGYRHMAAFIQGHLSWDEAVRTLKRDTRRYAKRQLTWFNKDPGLLWMNPDNPDAIRLQIEHFLQNRQTEPQ